MELSLEAIDIISKKYGKGPLYGFNESIEGITDDLEVETTQRIYHELLENELVTMLEGAIHISALGHHILNMMIFPEIFVMLENRIQKVNIKIYFKNAYYLCILERNNVTNPATERKIRIELLPGIKEVVSAFAYALYQNPETEPKKNKQERYINNVQESDYDIFVKENAWDITRNTTSDIVMYGIYENDDIHYRATEYLEDENTSTYESQCAVSEFINNLTLWVFDRLSEVMKEEEGQYGSI